MILWDQHMHSSYSKDAFFSMTDMALASVSAGLHGICFTDHCDFEHYDTGLTDPDCWRPSELFSAFEEARNDVGDRIELRLGLELGGGNHDPLRAAEIEQSGLDFIIGSIHNLRNMSDFYTGTIGVNMFTSYEACLELLDKYLDEYIELTQLGSFDVLGHIGYPLRYMRTMGFDVSLEPFTEKLSALFRELMLKGKGIELNTSGLRKWLNEPLPSSFILRLYRELGGEIITLGSDAHRPEDAGADIRKCLMLLKELGYKYYCVYKQRKPEFIKLEM